MTHTFPLRRNRSCKNSAARIMPPFCFPPRRKCGSTPCGFRCMNMHRSCPWRAAAPHWTTECFPYTRSFCQIFPSTGSTKIGFSIQTLLLFAVIPEFFVKTTKYHFTFHKDYAIIGKDRQHRTKLVRCCRCSKLGKGTDSGMAERLISIQDTNQFQTLCGSFDENLKLLEQRYHVRMICRGEELRVQGDGAQVELAAGAVTALLQMISNGQAITPQSIHYVSDMVDAGSAGQLAELADDDTVCLTAAGKPVHTRTVGQRSYVRAIAENTIVFGLGPAGTGKTYLAVAMAVRAFRRHEVNRIILTRPAVEAGEKLGFLPGDLQDKVDPYLRPLYDGLFEMLGAEAFQRNLERGVIEVAPLAYMRGRTLDHAFIILDEAQNTTSEQLKMFLTRLGEDSRMVITGDITQIDLPKQTTNGLKHAMKILDGVKGISFVYLTALDVVRHPVVARIIEKYDMNK